MVKYGLGQVDLNQRARLALFGLSGSPETDIADLLSSEQPIDPDLRKLLAAAFSGKPGVVGLKATGVKRGAFYRGLRERLRMVKIGEAFEAGRTGHGYANTVANLSKELRLSEKKIEAAITFSRKVRTWIETRKPRESDPADLDAFCLRIAYCHGHMRKADPEESVRSSLVNLASLLLEMDQAHQDASGLIDAHHSKTRIGFR